MKLLLCLQHWYARQCDGEWEHGHGITIQTCDNPGWWVQISLAATDLASVPFSPLSENIDSDRHPVGPRWLDCRVTDGTWHGAGDETALPRILETFLDWAEHPRD